MNTKTNNTTDTTTELDDALLERVAGGELGPDEDPSGSCLTPDTEILLADGGTKRVDELSDDDTLLVWDFDAGAPAAAPITFFHRVSEQAPSSASPSRTARAWASSRSTSSST
jgi:hypothetical protein